MPEEKPEGLIQNIKATSSFVVWFCQIASCTAEVFVRNPFSIGERYIDLKGLLAVPLIMGFSLFFNNYNVAPLMTFLAAFLGMCFVIRLGVFWRRWKKAPVVHSRYSGWPYLMWIFSRWDEGLVKKIEAVLVGVVGFFVKSWNSPLGSYLMFAAGAMFLSIVLNEMYQHNRALDISDAAIEQADLAARYRKMNNG